MQRKRSKRKFIIAFFIVVVIGIIIFLVTRGLGAPAIGSISQTPPTHQEKIDPYANPGNYNGQFISFSYPAHYKKITSQLSSDYAEVVDFNGTGTTVKHITVGVRKVSIDTDTGLTYRKQHPELYSPLPQTRYGQGFSRTDGGNEVTFFAGKGDLTTTISVTSPSLPTDQLNSDAQAILDSLQWR